MSFFEDLFLGSEGPEGTPGQVVDTAPDEFKALRDPIFQLLTSGFGAPRVRVVTHYGITRQDIEEALERVRHAVAAAV